MFNNIKGSLIAFWVGMLLLTIALVIGLIAIWSVGLIQGQLGGTATLIGMAGLVLAICGGIATWS